MDYTNNKIINDSTTPICRCRVMYLGSSVPHLTKDGLQGVQEPLKELYPENGITNLNSSTGAGIDSWISVWSNGILIENVDDFGREVRRFYPIESLHYCAAVRFVNLPDSQGLSKFLPLDSPYLRHAKSNHPPLFACILRRTTGIKVLECHAFVCKRETAANALVRCCFHAYADNEYVKQMDESPYAQINNKNHAIEKNNLNSQSEVDGKFSSNWDNADVIDSDNTTSLTQTSKKKNLIQNLSISKKSQNNKIIKSTFNNSDLNSDDNEVMTTNSSLSQNSPEEDEDITIVNDYKFWPSSKSLSGSVKNLNFNKDANKIAKGASMRSLRPRQMVIPNMLPPPMQSLIPIHALQQPIYQHQILDKSKGKLLKKMKSKSMITLVAQPPSNPLPPPPHAIPLGPQQMFASKQQLFAQQQMMLISNMYGHVQPPHHQMLPPMIPINATPQPITGNLHSIKKKSKKNKEKQQLLQQFNDMQFIGQQPMYIPPMRPITPLTNYIGGQNPIDSQKYLIQSLGYPNPNTQIYHTAPRNKKEKKNKKEKEKEKDKFNKINANELQAIIDNQNINNYNNQQIQNSNNSNSNSPFNTGIYRKKGHLNERAFSYSIRQEHRSRSNSVANLNFSSDEIDNRQNSLNYQQHLDQDHQYVINSEKSLNGNNLAPQRKLSSTQNGINTNSSQGSPSSLMQQQISRQQLQQQLYFQQQNHQLSDALNSLNINAQPKTASIKRSKLNNNNLLFHNGQFNSNSNKFKEIISSTPPKLCNGKLLLPTQNGNAPFDQHPDQIKKKSSNGKLLSGH